MSDYEFHQEAELYLVEKTGNYNKLTKSGSPSTLYCRYGLKTVKYQDSRGQDIEYHATLNTYYNVNIKKGNCIVLDNNLEYMIIDVVNVPDEFGEYTTSHCKLKEYKYA